jgi:hypothetical protein
MSRVPAVGDETGTLRLLVSFLACGEIAVTVAGRNHIRVVLSGRQAGFALCGNRKRRRQWSLPAPNPPCSRPKCQGNGTSGRAGVMFALFRAAWQGGQRRGRPCGVCRGLGPKVRAPRWRRSALGCVVQACADLNAAQANGATLTNRCLPCASIWCVEPWRPVWCAAAHDHTTQD